MLILATHKRSHKTVVYCTVPDMEVAQEVLAAELARNTPFTYEVIEDRPVEQLEEPANPKNWTLVS